MFNKKKKVSDVVSPIQTINEFKDNQNEFENSK